jgi:hypothetical protein
MTPEQALQILDRASALAALPRRDHVAVQQALAVLAEATKPQAAPPAPGLSPCG